MIKEKHLKQIAPILQHIFCLRVGRITFREVENAIFQSLEGDTASSHALMRMFLTGQVQAELVEQEAHALLRNILSAFSVPIRVAHDVHEQGDFLFTATAELMMPASEEQPPVFLHRVRRVDGQEFNFFCDVPRNVHMMRHFLLRFEELLEHEQAALIQPFMQDLEAMHKRLGEVIQTISSATVGGNKA